MITRNDRICNPLHKRKTYSVYDKRGRICNPLHMVIVITHNAKIACKMLYTKTGQWIDWKKDRILSENG